MPTKKIKNKKIGRKQPAEKPLTLSSLVRYNNKVFLPALELRFATKQELRNGLSSLESSLESNLESKFIDSESKIMTRFNDIADTLDYILKNTGDLDQEHTMQINTNQRVDKKIENHEKRIKKLEVTVK